MVRLSLHSNNSASRSVRQLTINREDGLRGYLASLANGTFWIALHNPDAGQSSILGSAALQVNGEPNPLMIPAHNDAVAWAILPGPGEITLSFAGTTKENAQIEAYMYALPKRLVSLLVKQSDEEIRTVIGCAISALVLGDSNSDAIVADLQPNIRRTILLGCAELLRRLRMPDKELTMLNAARSIEASRHVEIAIARAHANRNDWESARQGVANLQATHPDYLGNAHSDFLEEIEAHIAIGTELKNISVRPARSTNETPKLAYCLQNARPYREGGYAMRSHSIAKALQDADREIEAFVRPGFPDDRGSTKPTPPNQQIESITYHFENDIRRDSLGYRYLCEAADYFTHIFSEHSITIVQAATGYWAALPAAIAAHRLGLPFCYEVRSFWSITRNAMEPGFSQTYQATRDHTLEAMTLALADHVFTLNDSMRCHLSTYGVDQERVSIIHNCVDSEHHKPLPRSTQLAETYSIDPDDVVVGYIGAMLDYEGLDLLIEAIAPLARHNPRLKTLIIGGDRANRTKPGTIEFQLQQLIDGKSLGGAVSIIDRIPPHDVPAHYDLFDICAYPRKGYEVCELVSPLKPLEAMAHGKPIIVSDVGAMQEFVMDGETGLIARKDDVASLRNAIKTLTIDSGLGERIGAAAREFVTHQRSWKQAAHDFSITHDRITRPENQRNIQAIKRDLDQWLPKLF